MNENTADAAACGVTDAQPACGMTNVTTTKHEKGVEKGDDEELKTTEIDNDDSVRR